MSEMTVIKTDTGDIKLSPSIISNYLVRGNAKATQQEIMMFLSLCKFQKLNPFLNEAYFVKFGNSPAQIIVGKETFTKRAFNHPKFRGMTAGIIVQRGDEIMELEGSFKAPKDVLLGGWAMVHVEGRVPFKNTVSMQEYDKNQSSWKQMPCTMIRKVALVQALREAFPELFQAMYSPEEMPVDNEMLDKLDKIEMPKECVVKDNWNKELQRVREVENYRENAVVTITEVTKLDDFNAEDFGDPYDNEMEEF